MTFLVCGHCPSSVNRDFRSLTAAALRPIMYTLSYSYTYNLLLSSKVIYRASAIASLSPAKENYTGRMGTWFMADPPASTSFSATTRDILRIMLGRFYDDDILLWRSEITFVMLIELEATARSISQQYSHLIATWMGRIDGRRETVCAGWPFIMKYERKDF